MTSKRITIRRVATYPLPPDALIASLWGDDATLTTDHPTSNYGLPVVLLDGRPVGPAEIEAIIGAELSAEWQAMDDEYTQGADSVSLGIPWDRAAADAKRAATPRYDADTLALLDAARRAGYSVKL